MRLLNETIGIRHWRDEPFPNVSVSSFRGACYWAARLAQGHDPKVHPAQLYQSFHSAVITTRDQAVGIACLRHLPWVAFFDEKPPDYGDSGSALSPPPWAEAYELSGFELLRPDELSTPIEGADTSALTRLARKEIRYWGAETVADVLFNWWD